MPTASGVRSAAPPPAIGPILGGVLTEGLSWNWIFFVNLPVSIIAIVMSLRVLPVDAPPAGRRVDYAGTAAFTVAAGGLTFALIRAGVAGWDSWTSWGPMVLAAFALTGFVVIESNSDHAMVDLSLFREKSFVGTLLAALVLNISAFAALTYVSIWLQSVIGLSPIQAGLVGLPLAGAAFLVSASIGRLLHDRAPGPIIGGGLLLIGAGAMLSALLLHDKSSWPALIAGYVVIGVGVGLATPTLSSAAMGAVPIKRGGMASGMVNTMRQLGFAIGIAVLGSLFVARAAATFQAAGNPRLRRTVARPRRWAGRPDPGAGRPDARRSRRAVGAQRRHRRVARGILGGRDHRRRRRDRGAGTWFANPRRPPSSHAGARKPKKAVPAEA